MYICRDEKFSNCGFPDILYRSVPCLAFFSLMVNVKKPRSLSCIRLETIPSSFEYSSRVVLLFPACRVWLEYVEELYSSRF